MKYDWKKLKAAREKAMLTREELAQLAGVTRMTISRIERGAPWMKAIRKVATVLEVNDVVIPSKRKTA